MQTRPPLKPPLTKPPQREPVLRRAALALAWRLCLLAGAGAALAAPHVSAQGAPGAQGLPEPGDGFTWERVGDGPINAYDLAFGADGTLWAVGNEGPYRLDLSGGFPGAWEFLFQDGRYSGALLVLGRGPAGDTLLATTGLHVERSTDGGHTWEEVYHNLLIRSGPLYEVPAGLPHAGRVLVGGNNLVAYSDDRGTTWTASELAMYAHLHVGANALVALPQSAQYPGRLVAATFVGAALSDDGGATWRPSGLWLFYHNGEEVALAERSGDGSVNALMGGYVTTGPDSRVWRSEDEGETWGPGTGGLHLLESPPSNLFVPAVLALGGASAFVVLYGGTVYRTDDAGATWVPVGRAPDVAEDVRAGCAVVGPDGRLYVGLRDAYDQSDGWVWRTAEVVTTAEPGPEPAPEGLGVEVAPNPFRGAAAVTLTLPEAGEAEVALYDVLGRRVATLASGRFPAGRHETALEAADLPPGVYVVRVAAGGAVAARAVTVLR